MLTSFCFLSIIICMSLSARMTSLAKNRKGDALMMGIHQYKDIFDKYGGMMRTKELEQERIHYRNVQQLIEAGHVEKVRYGYYQWVNPDDFSEAGTVIRLFPDAILCMDTALRYYGYSDRTPGQWHLAGSKESGKSRFTIAYPFVKPYYIEPAVLELGLTKGNMDGHEVRIYDKDRLICDCLLSPAGLHGFRCYVKKT